MKLNRNHIASLKRARIWIASGRKEYICFALEDVMASPELILRIQSLLLPYHSVDEWLEGIGIDYKFLTDDNLRTYRVRWIDHMIRTKKL